MITVNNIEMECSMENWALLKGLKALLEADGWSPSLYPALELNTLIAERNEVFEANTDINTIKSLINDINLDWMYRDITLGVTIKEHINVSLNTVSLLLDEMESCEDVDNTVSYLEHLSKEDLNQFTSLFTDEELMTRGST
jgi:hypothetical protein